MVQYQKELEEKTADAISNEFHHQLNQLLEFIKETDSRLSQYNFLVNAGGSAAILAYLSTSSSLKFAVWSLFCFLIGIVASFIEIRALLKFYGDLHSDILKRLTNFENNEIPIEKLLINPNNIKIFQKINNWAGWISQISFILGVIIGLILFFCKTIPS